MFLKTSKTTLIDLTNTHIEAVCKGKPKDKEDLDYEIWHLIVIHDITQYRKDKQLHLSSSDKKEIRDDYSTYTIIQKCDSPLGLYRIPFVPLVEKIEAVLETGASIIDITDRQEYLSVEDSKMIAEALAERAGQVASQVERWNQRLVAKGDQSTQNELLPEGEKPDTTSDEVEPKDPLDYLKDMG